MLSKRYESMICESLSKKSQENKVLTKDNNSWKSRSTMKKVELNLDQIEAV